MNKFILREWLKQNLFSLLTLVLALAAIIISLRANQISERSNQIAEDLNTLTANEQISKVRVTHPEKEMKNLVFSVCNVQYSNLTRYIVEITTSVTATLINDGGRTVSLLGVSLLAGNEQFNAENPKLPVELLPGVAKTWEFTAQNKKPFDTTEEAMNYMSLIRSQHIDSVEWVFILSDKSTVSTHVDVLPLDSYRDLNTAFQTECTAVP